LYVADGIYKIQCVANNQFFDIDSGSIERGAPVIHYDARDRRNQEFRVQRNAALNTYTITAMHSNLVLDIDLGEQADLTPVIQWSANGRTNQQFRLEPAGAGEHTILAAHSGKALDASFQDMTVRQNAPDGGRSQRFRFLPV
jgi:alpha-galactosidase